MRLQARKRNYGPGGYRERWLGYQREIGPMGMFGPGLMMMQLAIDEGVGALASGDVVRMLRAHAALADYSDDD